MPGLERYMVSRMTIGPETFLSKRILKSERGYFVFRRLSKVSSAARRSLRLLGGLFDYSEVFCTWLIKRARKKLVSNLLFSVRCLSLVIPNCFVDKGFENFILNNNSVLCNDFVFIPSHLGDKLWRK